MKKAIIILIIGVSLFSLPHHMLMGEELFKKDKTKTIPPSYGSKKPTFTSKHLMALVNQGRIDQARQLVNLVGPQRAASVLVSMRLQDASRIVAAMGLDEAGPLFREMGRENPAQGALMFASLTLSNPELGARLYGSDYMEGEHGQEIKSHLTSRQSILNQTGLTSLLSAKDGEGEYIMGSGSAFQILKMYAQADGNLDWGNTEINALLNSGRAQDFFYLKIAQALLVVTDLDRMRALAAMKPKDAAHILKDMEPLSCANIVILMEPDQASSILAEDAISINHAVEILKEINKRDSYRTEEILRELEKLNPKKAGNIRGHLFKP